MFVGCPHHHRVSLHGQRAGVSGGPEAAAATTAAGRRLERVAEGRVRVELEAEHVIVLQREARADSSVWAAKGRAAWATAQRRHHAPGPRTARPSSSGSSSSSSSPASPARTGTRPRPAAPRAASPRLARCPSVGGAALVAPDGLRRARSTAPHRTSITLTAGWAGLYCTLSSLSPTAGFPFLMCCLAGRHSSPQRLRPEAAAGLGEGDGHGQASCDAKGRAQSLVMCTRTHITVRPRTRSQFFSIFLRNTYCLLKDAFEVSRRHTDG